MQLGSARLLTASVASLAVLSAAAVPLNETSLAFAVPTETEPVLDGRLDEDVWRKAVVFSRFVEYYKPHPKPSPLKSEMRILYTDRALWIGLVHFEPHPEKLKVVGTTRDSVDWTEDMDEIYVDPSGDAIGFTKFAVNSAGVTADMRRVDGSVVLKEWNGTAWRAKTSVGADRWTVEACIPYVDLPKPPEPGGAPWRLCVTRYQWTSGGFVGSESSPKGAYNNTAGFGYLAFLRPDEKPSAELVARTLSGRLAPPWSLWFGDRLLADDGDGLKVRTEEECEAEARREAARAEDVRHRLAVEFGGEE